MLDDETDEVGVPITGEGRRNLLDHADELALGM
jgi:hypothetical protein